MNEGVRGNLIAALLLVITFVWILIGSGLRRTKRREVAYLLDFWMLLFFALILAVSSYRYWTREAGIAITPTGSQRTVSERSR